MGENQDESENTIFWLVMDLRILYHFGFSKKCLNALAFLSVHLTKWYKW